MNRPDPHCTYCGSCTDACPQKALSIAGQETDVDTIMAQLRRDMLFFRYTNGGVTFSGGEPFSQIPFLRSLAEACYDRGITMWAETCGYFSFNESRDILEKLDHVFMDLKHMDSGIHRQYTGVGNEHILENAKNIYQLGIPLTFRIPAIPGVNLTEENILATARFIKQNAPDAAIELLPYHELGKAKYIALGKADNFEAFNTPTAGELKIAHQIFQKFFRPDTIL